MDWLEAVVHTTTMGADIVSEVLMNAGAIGTAIEDRYEVTCEQEIRRHVGYDRRGRAQTYERRRACQGVFQERRKRAGNAASG